MYLYNYIIYICIHVCVWVCNTSNSGQYRVVWILQLQIPFLQVQ